MSLLALGNPACKAVSQVALDWHLGTWFSEYSWDSYLKGWFTCSRLCKQFRLYWTFRMWKMPGTVCLCDQFSIGSLSGFMIWHFHYWEKSALCDGLWEGKNVRKPVAFFQILSSYLKTRLCPYYTTIVNLSHQPWNKHKPWNISYQSSTLCPRILLLGFWMSGWP